VAAYSEQYKARSLNVKNMEATLGLGLGLEKTLCGCVELCQLFWKACKDLILKVKM
jgi:hypothetical protein